MNELTTAIVPIINQLSSLFQVSTDYIQAHFMEYTLMYGRYMLSTHIVSFMWGTITIMGVVLGAILFGAWLITDGTMEDIPVKNLIKFFTLISIIIILLYVVGELLCYGMSPQIYSINEVMNLIQDGGK